MRDSLITAVLVVAALFGSAVFAEDNAAKTVTVPGFPKPMTWVNSPQRYQVTERGVEITAGAKTDRYIAPNGEYSIANAPRLVMDADENFILTVKITHAFAAKWDAGVLVLDSDEKNWIKFCFERDYTGRHRVVTVVTHDVSDDANSIEIAGNSVYHRLARTGDVIFMYVSEDGKSWFLVRVVNFKSKAPLKVGLQAQAPDSDRADISFSEITYKPVALKDFWKGE